MEQAQVENTKSLFSKIKNKTRMITLDISIQHDMGGLSQSN